MSSNPPIEVRLELFSERGLTPSLTDRIGALLARRWPAAWDVKIPAHSSLEHPAEWRAIVSIPPGDTTETVHPQLAAELQALDPAVSLRFRTRWAYQETPNHQEVYEERWGT
jgi:hypothetical protein